MARGRAAGVRVLVDTSAVLLGAALDAGPDVVTPNLAEAEAVLDGGSAGEPVDVDPRAARGRALAAATRLRDRGAGAAVVTAGAAGAAVAAGGAPWWVPAPRVPVANPIGAGDTFAAGLAVALSRGADLRDATLSATAAAAAGSPTRWPAAWTRPWRRPCGRTWNGTPASRAPRAGSPGRSGRRRSPARATASAGPDPVRRPRPAGAAGGEQQQPGDEGQQVELVAAHGSS